MQFVCLWCCVPPDFVVQINNFFSLVLFSPIIHKIRGKKLISKTIKYKLDSSSKMQFAFFYPKDIQNFFWKLINFAENLEMTQTAMGGDGRGWKDYVFCVIMTQWGRKPMSGLTLSIYSILCWNFTILPSLFQVQEKLKAWAYSK